MLSLGRALEGADGFKNAAWGQTKLSVTIIFAKLFVDYMPRAMPDFLFESNALNNKTSCG